MQNVSRRPDRQSGAARLFQYITTVCALLALAVLFAPRCVNAQVVTADVLGTVTDSTGALVPGATVTITNLNTSISSSMTTGKSGDYVFNLLPLSSYKVTVESKGFKKYVTKDFALQAGDRARVDAKLQVGAASETVAVSAEATPALATDSSAVGTVIDNTSVSDMPLNGENVFNLVQDSAGVTIGRPNSLASGNSNADRRLGSQYSVNGQHDTWNNNQLDGMDNVDRINGTTGVRPAEDAIEEVNVSTNLFSAEVGRAQGAVVNVITKSGSNKLKGTLYEFLRNDIFDSRDYFARTYNATTGVNTPLTKPELRQNQFGGSVGGPIKKDKTFFFADWEQFRQVKGQTMTSTVPTLQEETPNSAGGYDFTDQKFTYQDQRLGPSTTNITNYGTVIPSTAVTTIGKAYFSMYPAPNCTSCAGYNFVRNANRLQTGTTWDARVDEHLTDKDNVYGRYSYNDTTTTGPGTYPDVTIGGKDINPNTGYDFEKERQQALMLNYTHTIRPDLLLTLKAGFMRNAIHDFFSNYGYDATNLGFPACNATNCINDQYTWTSGGIPTLNGLGSGAYLPEVGTYFNYIGSVNWNHGAHSVSTGIQIIRRQTNQAQSQGSIFGTYTYSGAYTQSPWGDLLEDKAVTLARGNILVNPHYRYWEPAVYVQDNYRAKQWLTLNLGLRYEVYAPQTEVDGYMSNFNFATGLLVSPDLLGAQHSDSRGDVAIDWRDIAPRFGFAATPGHNMVVRGGYGITYYPVQHSNLQQAPFNSTMTCGVGGYSAAACSSSYFGTDGTYNWVDPTTGVPNPVYNTALATVQSNYLKQTITGTQFHNPNSYLEQFSLQVQKEYAGNVLTVGFVGNVMRHSWQSLNLNMPSTTVATSTSPTTGNPTACPYNVFATSATNPSACTTLNSEGSYGSGHYTSLQATFVRRLSKGLNVTVNYTWSHELGNNIQSSGPARTCIYAGCVVDNGDGTTSISQGWQHYDYGNLEMDMRQRLTAMVSYKPSFKSSNRVATALINGWGISAIPVFQTGMPFTVTSGSGTSGRTGVSGERPDMTASGKLSKHTVGEWFDISAFKKTATGTIGNERRNQLYGPPIDRVDVGLSRNFKLWESYELQYRADVFNLSNTPPLSNPGATISAYNSAGLPVNSTNSATFGIITSTTLNGTPRQFQMSLKLVF